MKYVPGSGKTGRVNRKHAPRNATHWEKVVHHGWKEVVRVSELGACWESDSPQGGRGYKCVSAQGRVIGVHRASYEHFNGPIPAGMLVRHRCDNPPCVNPDHLLVGSVFDNSMDMVKRDRHPHKLIEDEVRDIKALLATGSSFKGLARRYGVSRNTIRSIHRGETWAWLESHATLSETKEETHE